MDEIVKNINLIWINQKFQITKEQINSNFTNMQISKRNIFYVKQFAFLILLFEIYLLFDYCVLRFCDKKYTNIRNKNLKKKK